MTKTTVSINETDFLINGQPTYAGRSYEGQRIEGLLFNVRAVQATFDDANPITRPTWVYPDTGTWDPQRNTDEFCAALPDWKAHGVLAFTVNFQGGGGVYTPEVYPHYDNNGYHPDGTLKPAFADRMAQIIARADELGMVVILGMFYAMHVPKLNGETAVWRAGDATMQFLEGLGYQNVLIEIANEIEVVVNKTDMDLFRPENIHTYINKLRDDHPDFLYSTSHGGIQPETGRCVPPNSLIEAEDFIMPHGNGTTPEQLDAGLKMIFAREAYQANPKPMLINEDSPSVENLDVAWRHRVSWGYYDQGYGSRYGGDKWIDWRDHPRESNYADLSGFQTPPVNWSINTPQKRAFFNRVAQVTGNV